MTKRELIELIGRVRSNKYLMRSETDYITKALEEVQQYRAIGTVEECRKSVEICKSMIERNITPENMEEYMKFEDECVKDGFTFNSLLEAREKQKAKKAALVTRRNGFVKFYPCPHCSTPQKYISVYPSQNYCVNCGQKLDWSDEEYE